MHQSHQTGELPCAHPGRVLLSDVWVGRRQPHPTRVQRSDICDNGNPTDIGDAELRGSHRTQLPMGLQVDASSRTVPQADSPGGVPGREVYDLEAKDKREEDFVRRRILSTLSSSVPGRAIPVR
jgi:hypothetical protein